VLDIKTNARKPDGIGYRLQTAAQALLLVDLMFMGKEPPADFDPTTIRRGLIWLQKSGKYSIIEHNDPSDLTNWVHCVKVYHLRPKPKHQEVPDAQG
jgi:hypothetical protein